MVVHESGEAMKPVRVTAVSAFLLKVPVTAAFSASAVRGSHTHRTAIFVRLDTDAGVSGWGETFPALGSPPEAVLDSVRSVLAPRLIGADPLPVRDLKREKR